MSTDEDSDGRYARLLHRYPVGDLSADEFELWVADVLKSVGSEEGIAQFIVEMHKRVEASDGTYDVDATVRFRVLGLDFLVLVEAKHHRHPIKRELVQVLHSKVVSAGAQKGVMFSTAHFQSGALEYAKAHGIALVFVTEGRLTIERRSANRVSPASRAVADEWGVEPIVGSCYERGEEPGSTHCSYIGVDRPDLVSECLLGVRRDR